jgi:hypothetical protein
MLRLAMHGTNIKPAEHGEKVFPEASDLTFMELHVKRQKSW